MSNTKNSNHIPENGELKEFLEKDKETPVGNGSLKKILTMLEFLSLVRKDPGQALLAHAQIHTMIKGAGYDEVSLNTDSRRAKILGLGQEEMLRVPEFFHGFHGIEETMVAIDRYYYTAAGQGEESRQVLYLVGPPSSGKTTLVERIRRRLEKYGFWEIQGCTHHDSPLVATPRHIREELRDKYGIYIDTNENADICAQCRWRLNNELDNDFMKFKVVWRTYSQRGSRGIAVVSEVDPTNFDIGVLIGTEDISLLGQFERGDPRTLVLRGAFNRGNRGLVEFVEIFKNPVEAHRPIITATQEKYVPLPKFQGQIYVDTSLIAHSNESEWNKFKADSANEALLNRIKVERVPYNLRLTEEVRIYRESFLGRSSMFQNIHIDPHVLEQAAMLALLTRYAPSAKCDPLTKLKLYDGQAIVESGRVKQITLAELKEGAGLREGMVGLSYRDIMKEVVEESLASTRDQWGKDKYLVERGGYLNAIWIRDAMVRFVLKQDLPEDADWPRPSKKRWLEFTQDILHKEFLRVLENDLTKAGSVAFEEQAEGMFQRYLDHVLAFVNKKKVRDRTTKEELEPDTKFLESVEQHIGVAGNHAEGFRHEVATTLFDLQRAGERITWKSYEPLREAIEEKLKSLVRPTVRVIMKTRIRDDVQQKKYNAMVEELKRLGYAEFGIEIILRYADNNLWRD